MSRILLAAAFSAMGLFSFASAVRAADAPAAANPSATPIATNRTDVDRGEAATRPWRASETLGLRVENPQGEHLGKIEDLVFNPTNGHIRYAVLSFGGFLGVGEKWFAVPWKHLRAETKTGITGKESFILVLDVDKNKLKNAPGFDSKRWPDFGNPAYGISIDEFYADNAAAAHQETSTR